jgi:hypothetical protein
MLALPLRPRPRTPPKLNEQLEERGEPARFAKRIPRLRF